MGKKKAPPKKWRLHTLKSWERDEILQALHEKVDGIDRDLGMLKLRAYPLMKPPNADDVEHGLRRTRANVMRLLEQVQESDRVTLRTEKK